MTTLQTLERRRRKLLAQIADLPPMRKGSVATIKPRRTGKEGAPVRARACWRYTYKDKNQKTRGCHIAAKELARTYREQIAAFRRFQALSDEFLEASQALADLSVEKKGSSRRSAR